MLVLVETAAGYGLFKVKDKSLLKMSAEELNKHFLENPGKKGQFSLESFKKFGSSREAVSEYNALLESKTGKALKKFLKKNQPDEGEAPAGLIVVDKLLGSHITEKLNFKHKCDQESLIFVKEIKNQFFDLVNDLSKTDLEKMSLSLSHAMNRYKVAFSPEKVDLMVVQAVSLLEDVDRELNNLAMRLKEWYGFHFPELAHVVTDNLLYAKLAQKIGMRTSLDDDSAVLSDLVPSEVEDEIRKAASMSMGTEVAESDIHHINELADQVKEMTENREHLATYLKERMEVLAPNLTYMVGEILAARLISHAGTLISLSKQASSTVQLFGAEKALFRALKNQSPTPKYGIIFQASLVSRAQAKDKGRISRAFAAKLSLCARVDAMRDNDGPSIAIEARQVIEKRIEELKIDTTKANVTSHNRATRDKHSMKRPGDFAGYNVDADAIEEKTSKKAKVEVKEE
eukprot:GHVP01041825.1.p1 GENE.GHVP01041825.1~~GHVP01041825.1.p1  ORF type:complete len:458 (+),score=91.10 GHVP01041825.1:34-1407(+)